MRILIPGDQMNRTNSIRIFFVFGIIFILLLIRTGSIQREQQRLPDSGTAGNTEQLTVPETDSQQMMSAPEEQRQQDREPAAPVSGQVTGKYIVLEEDGYLTVYQSADHSVYEYTDIRYEDLAPQIRQEIKNGCVFPDEKSLFGFLENYSS